MNKTKIEWTDFSWNPVSGCLHNCPYCYAKSMYNRFGRSFEPTFHPEKLNEPLKFKNKKMIFVCSVADLFGWWVDEKWIKAIIEITKVTPHLTYQFLTCEKPQRSSYQPIPLFFNNIFETPIFSRVMAFFPTFWQMIQQSRFEQLSTFTSQAMPFKALTEVGFWDKHLVSEDSLIFWKFYIHYDGDWRTEPMHYPVSLDAIAMPTVWQSAVGLYKQQRRWAWGSENIPYMLCGFFKNKKIPLTKKIFWIFIFAEGFYSWATMPFILFFLGWLPLFLGGYDFSSSLLSYNFPKITGPIMSASMFGVVASAILSSVLLPARPQWFKKRHYLIYLLQWLLVPFVIIFFSAVPAIESQTRLMLGGKFRLGFWPTPKTRKI